MVKITKAQAKKMYDAGKTIYLNASKMKVNNPWTSPMSASKSILDSKLSDAPKFDALVNEFKYYNCSKETGLSVHFYKK